MPENGAPILIAGGGIGGLCAGIALAHQGLAVHILEAAPEFAELGAGLQIGPNGSRILAGWGLGEALAAQARTPERLALMDALSGRRLAELPLGRDCDARYGAPYRVLSRHVLHTVLLDAATRSPRIQISRASRVTGCELAGDRVIVHAGSGDPIEGRALVAADGVHSSLRREIFGGARALPSGKTALRALRPPLPSPGADAVCVWMAPNAHLVHYPIGPDGELNVVAVVNDRELGAEHAPRIAADKAAGIFRSWARPAREIVGEIGEWMRWPLLTMEPLARWSRGPAALLGDAAHPILPFLASGAVMAIEDASVLAQEVGRTPQDCAAAFQRYEARRLPRLARLRASVLRTGEIYHMSGAMRLARNLSLAAMPTRLLLTRNDWLYGFRV